MIKGNTVIFNEEYVEEVERHISNTEKQYVNEVVPNKKKILEDRLYELRRKLEFVLDFQGNIEQVLNIETPRLTAIKTTNGDVLPVRILKLI